MNRTPNFFLAKFKRIVTGSVRNKLVLSFLFILLVPSLAIGTFGYITAKDKVDDQLESMATSDIALISDMVDQYIQGKISDVNLLAQQINKSPASGLSEAYTETHPETERVTVLTGSGESASTSYAQAMENQGTVVLTEPYVSEVTGNTVVSLARTLEDKQSVVELVLNLQELEQIVGSVQIGENGFIVIFSASGANIVAPPWGLGGEEGEGTAGATPPLDASGSSAEGTEAPPTDGSGGQQLLFSEDSGEIDQVSPEGGSRHLIYITNETTGWKIAGDRSPVEVTNAAAPILNNTLIVIAVFTLIGAALMFFIVRSITRPLRALSNASSVISQGDLSRRADVKSKDEFGELGMSFNRMVDSLRSVVSEVSDSSQHLTASSQQLAASADQTAAAAEHIVGAIEQMADGAVKQADLVGDSSRTIHEVSIQIGEIVDSAQTAARATMSVAAKSEEGGRAVRNAVRQMGSISGSVDNLSGVVNRLVDTSREIGQIIGVISELSQQTNLLALNAAIEAARAGEEGKGFAVVADEVKKLAGQSAKSAEQVAALIVAIRSEVSNVQDTMVTAMKEVSEGIEVVETAGRLFAEIESSVEEVEGQVTGVSRTAEEISRGTKQVVKAIEDISGVSQLTASGAQTVSAATEQQMASMEELSSSSSTLTRMAVELQELVSKFKL